jgi:hypothetical protein
VYSRQAARIIDTGNLALLFLGRDGSLNFYTDLPRGFEPPNPLRLSAIDTNVNPPVIA